MTHMFEFSSYLEQENEVGDDALYVNDVNGEIWFCLSDGAGGSGMGYKASGYIIDAFKDLSSIEGFDDSDDFESFLRKLDTQLSRESPGAEATAIIGKVKGGVVTGASVGDSEAWLFSSAYDYELTCMQISKPLIGSGNSVPIGFGPINIDQYMLVGSDGLFKYAKFSEIKSLASCGAKAPNFTALAKKETGELQDDISILLLSKKS